MPRPLQAFRARSFRGSQRWLSTHSIFRSGYETGASATASALQPGTRTQEAPAGESPPLATGKPCALGCGRTLSHVAKPHNPLAAGSMPPSPAPADSPRAGTANGSRPGAKQGVPAAEVEKCRTPSHVMTPHRPGVGSRKRAEPSPARSRLLVTNSSVHPCLVSWDPDSVSPLAGLGAATRVTHTDAWRLGGGGAVGSTLLTGPISGIRR